MTKRARRVFSAEFKLDTAQLVLDQNDSVTEAAQAMNVGKSTMNKWVRQLREKRQGKLENDFLGITQPNSNSDSSDRGISSAIRVAVEGEGRSDMILPLHNFVVNLRKFRP